MTQIIGIVLIVGSGLLVVYAEGLHWIALWNLLPLVLAALAILRRAGAVQPSWSAIIFAGITTFVIALTHAAWIFDWGGTQTGSSTAGLIFLFSPIYSVLLGTVAWALVRGIEHFGRKRNAAQQGAPADAKKRRG
ncbi:MAG: hypothetical protein HY525_15585 [Betaproteobacteria bacterium]|nr:hypothetical protein [Betaproteobacteria bacterium]